MDSLNRIFAAIQESSHMSKKKKKTKGMVGPTPKGKANRYDHDSFGMTEAKKLSPKQKKIATVAGSPDKIDAADLAALRAKRKVNASTEIVNILNLIKEAYQDELISEEAFLAIADPIMRSLVEGRSVNFPDTYEMEDLDDAEEEEMKEEKPKLSPKQMQIAKVAGNPKKIDADDLAALRKKGKKK